MTEFELEMSEEMASANSRFPESATSEARQRYSLIDRKLYLKHLQGNSTFFRRWHVQSGKRLRNGTPWHCQIPPERWMLTIPIFRLAMKRTGQRTRDSMVWTAMHQRNEPGAPKTRDCVDGSATGGIWLPDWVLPDESVLGAVVADPLTGCRGVDP